MKDIDFDELDRAVNSLMKTEPDEAAQLPDDTAADDADATTAAELMPEAALGIIGEPHEDTAAEATPTVATVHDEGSLLQDEETLTQDQPAVAMPDLAQESATFASEEVPAMATPSPVAPISPVAPAARRGRFMDVVRPSSRDSVRSVTPRVSRQGVNLQPANMQSDAPMENEEPVAPSGFSSQNFSTTPQKMAEANQPVTTEDDTSMTTELIDDIPPLTSPFLADAKVEKRPLGRPLEEAAPMIDLAAELAGGSDTFAAGTSSATMEDSISPNKDAQLPEQPMPAELGSELLQIETSTDNLLSDPQPAAPVEAVQAEPTPTMPAMDTARIMTNASIPQQYKVQAATTQEAPAGAIYDTQPLAHPAKEKPGWFWVAIIIAIFLLGGAGGAAVYYLGLI